MTQKGRPIVYFSKALAPKHQVLSVYDKEMLAILVAIKKWHAYLVGRHFQIKTDHYSLKFFLDQQATTPAQQTWVVKMMGYDYEVIFKKGTSNTMADAISRRPSPQLFAISVVSSDVLHRIQQSWLSDPFTVHLIHKAKASLANSKYTWQSDQLRGKGKLVVGQDASLRSDLLKLFHDTPEGGP